MPIPHHQTILPSVIADNSKPSAEPAAGGPIVILSYGMGVESHAILERWIHEPQTRPFADFSSLIVVTSQVGEEHKCDTVAHVEARALPLMRQHGIRFVELARRGHLEEDGIVVLQDTRSPERLHPDGVYKLSDELLASGTVPQFGGGTHLCALKFKAFVIEAFLSYEFRGGADVPVIHVFGYNAEEESRIRASDFHIARHNEERHVEDPRTPIVVFGFNSEEIGRIERAKLYDGPNRASLYPLHEWGWTRAKAQAYILARCGIIWRKSHCSFCPFCSEAAKGLESAVARWWSAPEQTAHGMVVEFNSLCFNPRGTLFKDRALIDVIRKHDVKPVLEEFERRLASMRWGLYRVRRIYSAKGKAFRCVERLFAGDRDVATEHFKALLATLPDLAVETTRGIEYAFFQQRAPDAYPAAEGFYVTAPLFVESKVRGTQERFNERWGRVVAGQAIDGDAIDPNQDTLSLTAVA
jgi:hypothetical protein